MPAMSDLDSADHLMVDAVAISSAIDIALPQTLEPSSLGLQLPEAVMTSYLENGHEGSHLSDGAAPIHVADDAESEVERERQKRLVKGLHAPVTPKSVALPYASSRTGLVYDARMRFHVEPTPRDEDMHPEDPRRIYEVYMELLQAGLIDDPTSPDLTGPYVLLRIPVRSATREEICAVHSEVAFDFVMSLKSWSAEIL